MIKRFVIAAIVTLATTTAFAQTPAARMKAVDMAQGTWIFTSNDGQDMTNGPEIVLVIEGDKYTQYVNGEVVERGSFKIDESKKPMPIELTIAEGQDAGAKQLGVVEITEKTMRGKLSQAGAMTRPTDLEPSEGFFTFAAAKKLK